MKVGERGQVTIPKDVRMKFGIDANTRLEFKIVNGSIVLKKAPVKTGIRKWRGKCAGAFAELGYSSVDKFMDDIRGK
jgi:AbrB family looped-hinge helix DNA binding protein